MGEFVVRGRARLAGTLHVNGAKNSALPLMAAAILANGPVDLEGVPRLRDTDVMVAVLRELGATIRRQGQTLTIDASTIEDYVVPAELMQRMRASMFVVGPLLARMGAAEVVQPGGCAIGERPVNLHLEGFRALGADVFEDGARIRVSAARLKGASIHLAFPSVGATENLIMAAAVANGETHIYNAAREPEIVDLAQFLNKMGAVIRGAGTSTVRVEGVPRLHGGVQHTVIPDRVEAGTLMLAAAATGGAVELENALSAHLPGLIEALQRLGVNVAPTDNGIAVEAPPRFAVGSQSEIQTGPFPGFATDLQPQWIAFCTQVPGLHTVVERVFENRLGHLKELRRLGAHVGADRHVATVTGGVTLQGTTVQATDLRAGAALVIAGLCAEGTTVIQGSELIERGYEDLDLRLKALGADISRQ